MLRTQSVSAQSTRPTTDNRETMRERTEGKGRGEARRVRQLERQGFQLSRHVRRSTAVIPKVSSGKQLSKKRASHCHRVSDELANTGLCRMARNLPFRNHQRENWRHGFYHVLFGLTFRGIARRHQQNGVQEANAHDNFGDAKQETTQASGRN